MSLKKPKVVWVGRPNNYYLRLYFDSHTLHSNRAKDRQDIIEYLAKIVKLYRQKRRRYLFGLVILFAWEIIINFIIISERHTFTFISTPIILLIILFCFFKFLALSRYLSYWNKIYMSVVNNNIEPVY